jgi:hypothetical protein
MEDLEAESILASELGDENAPAGTKSWAIATVGIAHDIRYRVGEQAKALRRKIGVIEEFKAHLLLGYQTFEELCIRRLSLSPEQVKAIKNAAPGISIALALSKQAAQMVRDEKITHQEAADRVGVSRQAVTKAMATDTFNLKEKVAIPEWITDSRSRADFRKLSPEGQQLVATRKASLNSVCVGEGIRPQPVRLSPLELAQKSFLRLSKTDRDAFDLWRNEQPL